MRAQAHGGTWCRGHWFYSTEIHGLRKGKTAQPAADPGPGSDLLSRSRRGPASLPIATKARVPRTYKVFCWNVGGFSIVAETMWKHDSEFEAKDWYVLGSGSGTSKGQGVVVLLSKRRFRRAHIRFQAEIHGRLLHFRVTVGGSSLDIVAVYQHVWALKPSEPLVPLLHRRRRVWERLA